MKRFAFTSTVLATLFTACAPFPDSASGGNGGTGTSGLETSDTSSSGSIETTSDGAGSTGAADTTTESSSSDSGSSGAHLDDTGNTGDSSGEEGSSESGEMGNHACIIETTGPNRIVLGESIVIMQFSIFCELDFTVRNTELRFEIADDALIHVESLSIMRGALLVAGPQQPSEEMIFSEDYAVLADDESIFSVVIETDGEMPSGVDVQAAVRYSDGVSMDSHLKNEAGNYFLLTSELSDAGATYLYGMNLAFP